MADDASRAERRIAARCPCLPIAIALGSGIAIDHAIPVSRLVLACGATLPLLAIFLFRSRLERWFRAALLLLAIAALGALSHRSAWSDQAPDSVTRLLDDEPRLVNVAGTVVSLPDIERRRETGRAAAWPLEDRSRVIVALDEAGTDSSTPVPLSGRVQLAVAGHLSHIGIGDRVEVIGWLAKPEPPRNPGGFDARSFLRQRCIDGLMYADHPDAVRRVAAPVFHPRRAISRIRDYLSTRFATHLSGANAATGSAMVLGDRSSIPIEVREAYIETGAMHILAISGLHVGILAAFLMFPARLLNLPLAVTAVGVAFTVWGYAILTNLSPSVVRASVFITLWCVATIVYRQVSLLNVAAVTAFILLLWNPLLLFDLGAQLSFAAVLGMSWSMRMFPKFDPRSSEIEGRSWIWRRLSPVITVQVLGVGIWLFTAPLIAARFGIVSPIGLLLNVVLLPLTTGVMWTGYLFFGSCLFAPLLAPIFGATFDFGLTAVNWLVATAGKAQFGHFFTPSPPDWWLLGYYPLLAATLVWPKFLGNRLRSVSLLLFWAAVGLGVTALSPADQFKGLRLTALDVGHGGAILIEAPTGASLLYDCGSMQDDRWVAESVWRCLRDRGKSSLDLVVLSHADLDHCNNLPALVDAGRVHKVLMSRTFLDLDQPVVVAACRASFDAGAPIELVYAGDELRLDREMTVRVLHPPDQGPGEDDNANSVVLRIDYAGRSILLTGDIEGSGQEELMSREPKDEFDVVIAPHHGGSLANTTHFAQWAQPEVVIVSCGNRVNAPAVRGTYASASQVYFTSRHGAITVEISPDGRFDSRSILKSP